MAHGTNNKCIGTSTGPYVPRHAFPRITDQEDPSEGYNNNNGSPGYGMGPDGRRRQRRFGLSQARTEQVNSMSNVDIAQGVVGRSTTDGRWPLYTEILDYIPSCD